jgi:hypothetical protein
LLPVLLLVRRDLRPARLQERPLGHLRQRHHRLLAEQGAGPEKVNLSSPVQKR